MSFWNKKILAVLMQWDYGKRERGESLEKACFYSNLTECAAHVEPLWIDDYLQRKDELQKLVLAKAEELQPDLVFFVPIRDEVSIETLDILKKKYATFGWFGDDQWRFDNYTRLYAPHYTYVSTTDPSSVAKYRAIGMDPVLTQWAAQPFCSSRGPLGPGEKYQFDVSFIGGANPYRQWFISFLRKQGITVHCFGAGWPNGRISFTEMEEIFRKSKINLNLSNSVSHDVRFILGGPRNFVNYLKSTKRVEQMKARNFEIPLAGGFQLTNYVAGLERYFRIWEEIGVYALPEDCAHLIGQYLHDDDLRTKICQAGFERACAEHTYFHRLQHIFTRIWN